MKSERIEIKSRRDFRDFSIKISDLIKKAKTSIDMSTSLYPEFYMEDKIKKSIEKSVEKVSTFRLLLGGDINRKTRESVPWIFDLEKKSSNFIIAKTKDEIKHYVIVDNKHLRIEEKHPPNEPGIKNLIVYDAPIDVVMLFKKIYEKWWERATDIA